MKRHILLIFIFSLLLIFSSRISAQRIGILSGTVIDSTNKEVLAFCTIYIPELKRGTITDSKGMFLFAGVEAERKMTLIASYVGYAAKKQFFQVAHGKMTKMKIMLSPLGVDMKEVEIEAVGIKRENATDVGLHTITARELESLPKAVEVDVLRSLQYLPGVQFAGDASAHYYVRGGANNENLILLDNITVYNPYHALGLFSSIDPEMINNIEFYKSAFPTEFTGRLSSVLKIETKDGDKNKFGAKASLSMLSAKALVEGPIPSGSYIITGRKSIATEVLKKFTNNKDFPYDFYDLSFKVNYSDPKFVEDAKFSLHGYFSGDNINNKDPFKQDFRWTNDIIGFNYFQLSKDPLFYNITFSYSHFSGEVFPNATQIKPSRNTVSDVTGKIDITYVYESKDVLSLGLNIEEINTSLFLRNSSNLTLDVGGKGTEISFYTKYMFLRLGYLGAEVGSRVNLARFAGAATATFEPRARLTYRFAPEIALKLAWGIYKQELTTISDENEAMALYEPWVITPRTYKPAKAVHYVTGIETEFIKNYIFNLEAYYKTANNILILNENRIGQTDNQFINGNSESYGMEALFKNHGTDYSLNLSYTLAWAFKEVNGIRYKPRYDTRHNVSATLDFNVGYGWRASIAWLYTSGHPFTQIAGYYDKLNPGVVFADTPFYEDYYPRTLLGDKNIAYLPDYHRLDITVSKSLILYSLKLDLDISAINAYNRTNIFYFNRTTGEQVNMLPLIITGAVKIEL